jgi:integrase
MRVKEEVPDPNIFLRKPGDDHYTIRYDLPPSAIGKRRQKMEACPAWMGIKEVRAKLRAIEQAIYEGRYGDSENMTVSAYLDKWLRESCLNRLEPGTYASHKNYIDAYINPALGTRKLEKLRPLDIQAFYNQLRESGRRKSQGGLSAKTIKNIHGVLHSALAQATKWQILSRNPTDNVDLPRYYRVEAKATDAEGLGKLLDAIWESPWKIPILISLATGIRRGEVLALRWEDYDAERGTLLIRHAVKLVNGKVMEGDTKNHKIHAVLLPKSAKEELDAYRVERGNPKEGLIYPSYDGKVVNPRKLTDYFSGLAKTLDLGITLHGLRHTQVTLLIQEGVDLKTVSAIVDHATVAFTADRYGHVTPLMRQKAAGVFDEIIKNNKPKS